MRKRLTQLTGLILALVLAAAACPALSEEEGTFWDCPNCEQTRNMGNYCSYCGEPRPTEETADTNEDLEQIPGETDRVKIAAVQVAAASYIVNKQEPDRWLPENAADGNETTCWQFSTKQCKLGKAWLDLYYSRPQTADEVWIKPGFWAVNEDGDDENLMNSRPKQIKLEFLYDEENSYRDAQKYTLQDDKARSGWQKLDIGHRENITALRMTVLSKYDGYRFKNDVCVSEIMLVRRAPAAAAKAAGTVVPRIYEATVGPREATLKRELSTRSGPGTEYDEPGKFFKNNWQDTTVTVLGKSYDNSIWWVLLEFSAKGGKYRAWTGAEKRVNVNLDRIPEIYAKGQGTVDATDETYRGPGLNYAEAKITIPGWQDVLAFGRENGFVEVEYSIGKKYYRVWVPEQYAHIDWQ